MNRGAVPGAFVPDELLAEIVDEWKYPKEGLGIAIERTARLGAVLKGLGYRGMHLGGIHRTFKTVAAILDRMEEIKSCWRDFLGEFHFGGHKGFYAFPEDDDSPPKYNTGSPHLSAADKSLFQSLRLLHHCFFDFDSPIAPFLNKVCELLDRSRFGSRIAGLLEGPPKKVLLDCRQCGDCGIQHVAFLCPESKCPKHIRNGACGGSRDRMCEVHPDRKCVWFRAYERWAAVDRLEEMTSGCVPPRMWELDRTPSWLNFHLKRDHQSASNSLARFCRSRTCRLPDDLFKQRSRDQ